MADVGVLNIKLSLDSSELSKGITNANNLLGKLESSVNKIEGAFKSLEGVFSSFSSSAQNAMSQFSTIASSGVSNTTAAVERLRGTVKALGTVGGKQLQTIDGTIGRVNASVRGLGTHFGVLDASIGKVDNSVRTGNGFLQQMENHLKHLKTTANGLNAEIQKLSQNIQNNTIAITNLGSSANRATGSVNQMGSSVRNAGRDGEKSIDRMTNAMSKFHRAASFAYMYISLVPRKILEAASEYERMVTLTKGLRAREFSEGFEVKNEDGSYRQSTQEENQRMINVATKGDTEFIYDMAKKAPFQLGAIQDAFVKLKTGGVDPLDGSLKILLDSVAKFGGDSNNLKRAAIAIQQMGGKGVVSMEELRQQLAESIPDAMQAMADGLGWTVSKLAKEISLAHVSAETGIRAMLAELEKRNNGASEEFMKTWTGRVAKLKTTLDLFFIDLAKSDFLEGLKDSVKEFTEILAGDDLREFARQIGSIFSGVAGGLAGAMKIAIQFKDVLLTFGALWIFRSGVAWAKEFGLAMAESGNKTLGWWREVWYNWKDNASMMANLRTQQAALQQQLLQTPQTSPAYAQIAQNLQQVGIQIDKVKGSSTLLGSVWQQLTGGAGNLRGLLVGLGTQLATMAISGLIMAGVIAGFSLLKKIWDDISGKTAQDLEDSLKRINNGLGGEEDYNRVVEKWEQYEQQINYVKSEMEDLTEETAEYAKHLEWINQLRAEQKPYEDAKNAYEGDKKVNEFEHTLNETVAKVKNAEVAVRAAVESGKSAEEIARLEHELVLAKADAAKIIAEGTKKYTENTDKLTQIQLDKIRNAVGRAIDTMNSVGSALAGSILGKAASFVSSAVRSFFGSGGKYEGDAATSDESLKIIKESQQKLAWKPRPTSIPKAGGGGGSGKKSGSGRRGRSGGGGGQHDSTGDWIKDLQSQAMILRAENESLMEGLNTLEDINKKAELLVKQRNKNGKMSKKQLEDAKNAEVALLKEKTANELLKKATDDLNASQEDLKWSSLETEKGYGKLSSSIKSLLKQYAKLERKMSMLKDKDGNEMKELKVVRDRLNQSVMSKIASEAIEMGKQVQKEIDQLQINWIADTQDRRRAQTEFAIQVVRDELEAQLAVYEERQAAYAKDSEEYIKYEELKAKVTEAYLKKIELARLKAQEAAMTASQKQEAEWADVTKNMEDASKNWASSFTDNIQKALEGGKVNWRSFLASMISDMNKVLIQKAFGGAINQMFDSIGKSSANWINGIAGASIAGARNKSQIINDNTLEEVNRQLVENVGDMFVPMKEGALTWYQNVVDIGQEAYGSTRKILGELGSGLMKWLSMLWGNVGTNGQGGSGIAGMVSSGWNWFTSLWSFANGGIMTSKGKLPLNAYAGGGIANKPQLAMFGEGARPEAFVPLPDGKSIPVTLTGGVGMGGNYTPVSIQINVDNNGGSSMSSNGGSGGDNGRNQMWSELAQRIKGMVVEEINTQKRPGGVLY